MAEPAFETIRYEVDGPIATITLARPDAANAQNSRLIDELDAAFDRADADDDVRVVVLAAEGKHFSAGHDLKELLAAEEHWAAMRDTPEGKLVHEQVMYFDKLVRIRDFRKLTIAAVQGTCSAAGPHARVHVRPDRRRRRRAVLQPGAAHVGRRRGAAGRAVGARAAQGEGVPVLRRDLLRRGSRALRAREPGRAPRRARRRGAMAGKVALVPALTAEMVKASINHMVDGMGQRESWQYHFMLHQFVSNTPTALAKVEARKQGGMDAVKKEQR